MGLWHLFFQLVWNVSRLMEAAGVLGEEPLVYWWGSCRWCGLHLSDKNPLGLLVETQQQKGQGQAGMEFAWGKGHRGQNPERGTVPLASRSLAHSEFCVLGLSLQYFYVNKHELTAGLRLDDSNFVCNIQSVVIRSQMDIPFSASGLINVTAFPIWWMLTWHSQWTQVSNLLSSSWLAQQLGQLDAGTVGNPISPGGSVVRVFRLPLQPRGPGLWLKVVSEDLLLCVVDTFQHTCALATT